jgi:succinate dehydrogenase/fumarate reductase cytochrome b subunit (b558 family)
VAARTLTYALGFSYYSSALSTPETSESRADHRAFLLRRLHSITGVVPVGVFLILHLWTNSKALQGEDAFAGAVNDIQGLPYLPLIEIFGIFLPLAYHSFYGVYLAFQGKQSSLRYRYARNWLYFMQRASGMLALAFILYHLGEFRVQKWLFGMPASAFYQTLEAHLSSTYWGVPWTALLYLTGVAATVFHFANGLSGVCMSWGITLTRAAQRRATVVCWALGLVLFGLGTNTVLFFATGSKLFVPNELLPHAHAMAIAPASPPR